MGLFSFPSLAAKEQYRQDSAGDPECKAAYAYAEETRCIVSYERSFMRPVNRWDEARVSGSGAV